MKAATFIGRVGGLAVALGTGAWLASVPWMAAADTSSSLLSDLAGLDAAALLPSSTDAAADSSLFNIDISYNGQDVFHMGDATANSGTGDLAIAYGDGSTADAGYGTALGGLSLAGQHDSAFADGAGSTAIAGGGDGDSATATDGATAYSGLFEGSGVAATGGADDTATASGAGSLADAFGQSDNSATASDGATADSGFTYSAAGHALSVGGIGDSATASGADSSAIAAIGNSDSATVYGTDSSATAGFGSGDTADVFGNSSTALAGGTSDVPVGDNDLAAVFGSDLSALAGPGSGVTDIEPSSFADLASILTPSDDFGLSNLLADLSSLGL
jgi:hypothetical protein